MRIRTPLLIAATIGIVPVTASAAGTPDRAPTEAERAAIVRVLQANGFVAWDDIELDDGRRWEVDDARLANGETYDLKLAPDTLRITRRSRDD
ncbi:PepSY domain-containing protein [Sphingosinicella sp. BN140058]|uniref:PepSY domain-containing protein n=1 Tax=Sphingosinicella sp. BN140058 TaxID=1892855 RepID=UPI001013AA28|nr:PepSY domain-containing protein [Sphingosinicella sp. BN140058]QAY78245.1 PepSY domain-containing protein [Sphingosinicella sp. BN140058]